MSQLTSVMTQSQQEYRPGLWAVLLHQIPHVNITFHRIHDDRYSVRFFLAVFRIRDI
jgi:hypothetical protein